MHVALIQRIFPLTLVLLMLAGCGGDAPGQTEPKDEPVAAEEAAVPAQPASEAVPASATPGLTLADLDPAETIPVGTLHAVYFAWKNQPVTLGGYLWSRTSRGKITQRIGLTGEPGGEAQLAGCRLADPSGERVKNDVPLVVKGTYTFFTNATIDGQPKLELEACEVVSVGEPFDAGTPAEPGQAAPIPVDKLYAAITGWQGRQVTVQGYYHSSTHSSADDKTGVALKPDRSGKTAVICKMPGKDVVPEGLAENRAGVIMRGTVGEPTWNEVILEDCAFVNRP